YLYPVGNGDRVKAINEMMAETKAIGRALQIYSVSKTDKEWMEENFKDVFEFEYSRDECDYVYASEALQNLQGKKMQKKRNHVAKFLKQNPDFVTEKITKENISEVIAFDNKWAKLTDNVGDKGIAKEHKAVDLVLENYFKLPLEGCLIRVDEKIIAFSYGSAISDKVFCTHVEKALYEVEGAYNIINREFARLFCKDYLYINREDDVGSEGLRKAKLSYKPEFLEEKYIAVLKGRKTECFV
ncbi:MAG: phosphatidylglycerol lysyltransferase domain-containing protein, partial [Oscillospiraceae bacterium]